MPNSLRNQIIVAGTVLILLSVLLTGSVSLIIRFNDPLSKVDEQFQIRSAILNTLSALVIEDVIGRELIVRLRIFLKNGQSVLY